MIVDLSHAAWPVRYGIEKSRDKRMQNKIMKFFHISTEPGHYCAKKLKGNHPPLLNLQASSIIFNMEERNEPPDAQNVLPM